MKKFLSVALAVIIALSVFSLNAFAVDSSIADGILGIFEDEQPSLATQTTVETDTDAEIDTPEPAPTRAELWVANNQNFDELKLDIFFISEDLDIVMYVKGDKACADISGYVNEKHYYDIDSHYVIDDSVRFLYIEQNDGRNIGTIKESLHNIILPESYTYADSYEKNGYYIEEFHNDYNGNSILYYFDGDDIVKLSEINSSGKTLTTIKISYDVKDSDVNIPFFAFSVNTFLSIYLFFFFIFGWLI